MRLKITIAGKTLINIGSDESDWIWYGQAAHLIVGHWCRFHMATKCGKYLISTVGEYWPERAVREIHADIHDPQWLARFGVLKGDNFDAAYMERFGYQEVGCGRKYETMVFVAGAPCKCGCGVPLINSDELDTEGCNTAEQARLNHIALCKKWSEK